MCEKLRIFQYGQYIIKIYVSLAFWRGVSEKCTKKVTLISRKMDFLHMPQHAIQWWAPMMSLLMAGVYCTRTLLGRRICKRLDLYMITLSCSWQIYALYERLLVKLWYNTGFAQKCNSMSQYFGSFNLCSTLLFRSSPFRFDNRLTSPFRQASVISEIALAHRPMAWIVAAANSLSELDTYVCSTASHSHRHNDN